jgi:hypothetical protein
VEVPVARPSPAGLRDLIVGVGHGSERIPLMLDCGN